MTPDFYDIRLSYDQVVRVLVSLRYNIDEIKELLANSNNPDHIAYYKHELQAAMNAREVIIASRPVYIDDMEKEAAK